MNLYLATVLLASSEAPTESWPSANAIIWQVVLILVLVLLNGIFVAAEFAIVKVRTTQIDELIDQGSKRASKAKKILQRLDVYLSATQLGITMASVALSMFGEKYISKLIEPVFYMMGLTLEPGTVAWISFGLAFLILTGLHVIVGELLPKSLAVRRALGTTLWLAGPLAVYQRSFGWIIAFLTGIANKLLKWIFHLDPVTDKEIVHSAEELQMLVEESGRSKRVTATERDISINALELNDRLARDIMTPRTDIIYLDLGRSFDENLNQALSSKHTRFPIREGSLDNVPGIVHIKDILRIVKDPRPDILHIARPPLFVPEIQPLDELLKSFLTKHAHMALVVDENGVLTGMLTLDDVLEELVGEIQDEFDSEEERFKRLSESEFVIEGKFPLYELAELTDLELEKANVSTLGGFVTAVLGRLPHEGETVHLADVGYIATVTKMDGRRVVQVHLKKAPDGAAAAAPRDPAEAVASE
jgi:CBS domain containing-hemolysin-like protein